MTRNLLPQTFDSSHPFWKTAVALRQGQESVAAILQRAHQLGYKDLSYSIISVGLARAPIDLQLPLQVAKTLRKRYQDFNNTFDAMVTMRDLTQEALRLIVEISEEIHDPDISMSRKMYLEGQVGKWYDRAFDWASRCAELAVKIRGQDLGLDMPQVSTGLAGAIDMQALIEEMRQRLPEGPPAHHLIQVYGGDNVRPPQELETESTDDEET